MRVTASVTAMTRLALFVTLLASSSLLSGCVTQKKYDALQREFDDSVAALQGQIDEKDAQMATLQEALASEEERRAACDQEVMDLGARIQPLEDQYADMRDLRDAADVATVHDNSWLTTYRGIIPQANLERMIVRRGPNWWRLQSDGPSAMDLGAHPNLKLPWLATA